MDKTYDSGTDMISASFEPTSYFTEKNGGLDIQVFACSTEEDFTTEDVDINEVALWSTFNAQISIAKSQLKDSQTIVAEDMFTKGIAEMSAYLASAEEEADASEEYASDAEEFARGTRSDGNTVPHASTGAHDNAKDYKDLAKDWASKIGGTVESGEYSAKYYATVADTRSQEAEAYAIGTKGGTPVPAFADKNAKDWATKTGSTVDGTNYSSKQYALDAKASADIVAEHATAIDSIYADLTNIDAVATDIQDDDSIINTVAENIHDVNAVAESITDVNDVADDLNDADSNIKAVVTNMSDINDVADNIGDVNTVAGKVSEITTVAGIDDKVTTVAGIASNVTTVAGIDSDVTAVAGIASDVSAVEDIKTDVSAVASIDDDVSAVASIKNDVSAVATIDDDVTTVATAISDVSTVASYITKVTAVADDLTNIDAVADDLTNIDNAVNYALEAEGWANGTQNGTPVSSDSPYYENNAKYWADAVPNMQSQIVNINGEIENIEGLIGEDAEVENTDPSSGTLLAQSRLIHHANLLPNGSLGRLGARAVKWVQLIDKTAIPSTTTVNGITFTNNGDGSVYVSGTASADAEFRLSPSGQPAFALKANNKYIMHGCPSTGSASTYYIYDNYWGEKDTGSGNVFSKTADRNVAPYICVKSGTVISTPIKFYPQVNDLTDMGMASITADQFRALFPASYYPHDTGHIYDLNPSGFLKRGINLWDEETELGDLNDGVEVPASNRIRAKNYIRVNPSTQYYCFYDGTGNYVNVAYFDIEKNFISDETKTNTSFTTPNNCCFIRIWFSSAYGTSYGHNIQIAYNSFADSLKQTYHSSEASTILTSQISDGHYVNDSCYDYVENVEEDGQVKGKFHDVVDEVDLATLIWTHSGNYYYTTISDMVDSGDNIHNLHNVLICEKYFEEIGYGQSSPNSYSILNKQIWIRTTETPSGMCYYKKATESVTDCEPLRSFPVSDYCTIEPITPQTELVNRIDVPFSVKTKSANTLIQQIRTNTANIATEVATRSAQVSALNKRVTNLELNTGDLFDVTYPSSTYGADGVPANVEPYAKVDTLIGKSRAWNQLCENGDFSNGTTGWGAWSASSTRTVSDGVCTVTAGSSGECSLSREVALIEGHKILIACSAKSTSATGTLPLRLIGNTSVTVQVGSLSSAFSLFCAIADAPVGANRIEIYKNTGTGVSIDVKEVFVRDLTLIFPEGVPSTVSECVQKCPDILKYDAYGSSIVSTTVEGVKAIGRNRLNPTTFKTNLVSWGGTDNGDGTVTITASSLDRKVIWENNTEYDVMSVYFGGSGTLNAVIRYTDGSSDYMYINTWATSNGSKRVKAIDGSWVTGSTTFNVSSCGILTGSTSTWSDYDEQALSLPTPFNGKSAGSVADTDELNVEVKVNGVMVNRRRQTVKTLTVKIKNLSWDENSTYTGTYAMRADISSLGIIQASNDDAIPYVTTTRWKPITRNNQWGYGTIGIAIRNNCIYINDSVYNTDSSAPSFKTAYGEEDIVLALQTPSVTLLDTVEDTYIKVEPNGTVRTIQSQTPEIDSAMTVEYMAQ